MILLILLCAACLCEGYNVLVVSPVPERSHSILIDSLVSTLVDADYEVTYVTPYPKEPQPNLRYVDISSVLDQILEQGQTKDTDLPEDTSSPRFLPLVSTRIAQQVLKHPDVQELSMNTTMAFDAVLVEWFYTGLLAPLAAVFECPLIWYSSSDISWQSLSLVTSTSAHRLDLAPDSLLDRLHQMWSQFYLAAWNYFYISRVEIPAYERSYRDAFSVRRRRLPNYEELVHDGSLLLINSHPLLSPTISLPPNVKYIGGHHLREDVSPLPKHHVLQCTVGGKAADIEIILEKRAGRSIYSLGSPVSLRGFKENLKKLMDGSEAGVIYVNVETNLMNGNTQERITQQLQRAFSELEQTVVWKHDDILVNLPHNVYTLKNPPQHAILNHVNTIAFINHADMFSIIDAAQYAVPVIGLPLLEDQLANANMLSNRGCGVKLETKNLSWEVKKAIKTVLVNSSFQTSAKSVKSTFRHHLATPQQEFLHWVETVIMTRGANHLRSPTLQTSTLERYNGDIILLALMLIWFLAKVVKVIRVHLDANEEHEKDE